MNGVDNPQKFDLGDRYELGRLMGGSPPVGTYITTVRDFVLMGKIGIDAAARAVVAAQQCRSLGHVAQRPRPTFRTCPTAATSPAWSAARSALIFQETSVRRMTYEGPPIVFRIDKIANDIGASVPGSVAGLIDMAFFLHKSGFYMVRAGQTITPIGRGKVDRTFWAEFDETNQFRSSAGDRSGARALCLRLPGQRQQRRAQPAADLQLAHRAVGACQGRPARSCSAA